MAANTSPEERGLAGRIGPVEVNWPQTVGYYGGIGIAVAAGVLEPPLALFIAAIPFFKMLNQPQLPRTSRFVGELLAWAAKPVGGDAEATLTLVDPDSVSARQPATLWAEARRLADRRQVGGR